MGTRKHTRRLSGTPLYEQLAARVADQAFSHAVSAMFDRVVLVNPKGDSGLVIAAFLHAMREELERCERAEAERSRAYAEHRGQRPRLVVDNTAGKERTRRSG